MKKKTLTINITAAKFNRVAKTEKFQAIVSTGRMMNAFDLVFEAGDSYMAAHKRSADRLKPVLVMLHRMCRESSEVLHGLTKNFDGTAAFGPFVRMCDQMRDKLGPAPAVDALMEFRITSDNSRVSSAIRDLDLLGSKLMLTARQSGSFDTAAKEIEAEQSIATYQRKSGKVAGQAYQSFLAHTTRYTLEYTHAARSFIAALCKEMKLEYVEEVEVAEAVGVH